MDRRIKIKDEIQYCFSHVITRVKRAGKLNFTDAHIVAEDFFKSLLNRIYGYELKNSNAIKQNENAIDLYFKEERICYQITSQNKPSKIREAVDGFIKSKKFNEYSEFIILSITDEKKCNSDALLDLSKYNTTGKYKNISDLEREILFDFETDRLEQIAEFLKYETIPSYSKPKNSIAENIEIEKLKKLHIVDQIHTVLKQFDGFTSIHPRAVARLFPFNSSRRNYDVYSHYCLKTDNIELHKLFQKITINDKKEIKFTDEALKPFEEKLKEIFSKLNHSLIRCICYREKHTEIEHHKIDLIKYDEECNCNSCKYHKFRTKELFSLLKEKAITPSDDLSDAVNEGYYLAKVGEHVKAYQIFSKLDSVSLSNKQYVVNYIVNHNLKKIRNFIDAPWLESEKKSILPVIDNIDLYDKLDSNPKDVKEELIRLKEDYYLHYSREMIEDYVRKIIKTYNLYKGDGSQSSASIVVLLWEELHILQSFYISNSLLIDDFYSFQETISKGIEGIFISYATSDRYADKYKNLDSFIFKLIIFYVEEDRLNTIFKNYGINKITLAEKETDVIIKISSNFFESQISRTFFGAVEYNEDLNRQEYFSHYRQNLRNYANRMFLILSKLETNEALKKTVQPIIDYINGAKDFNNGNWGYFVQFFRSHVTLFSTKQLELLFEVLFISRAEKISTGGLTTICKIASRELKFEITDNNVFQKIHASVLLRFNEKNRRYDKEELIALYLISDPKGKESIKINAIDYLNSEFDPNFYEVACFYKLFSKNEQPEFLNKFLDNSLLHCTEFDYKEENDKWIAQSYSGINSLVCLAHLGVDFNHPKIQLMSKKSDYYEWLINPKEFDYGKFKISWLKTFIPFFVKNKVRSILPLKKIIERELAENFDSELAKLMFTKRNNITL